MRERLVAAAAWSGAGLVVALFGLLVGDLVRRGGAHLSWHFLVDLPSDAGRAGGIAPILVSTLLLVVIALAVAAPLALLCALFLDGAERSTPRAVAAVRASLDVLGGVPSIVFGLFGNALFCRALGLGFSLLAGGLTLACMVLPLMLRAADEGLRAVAFEQRQAAAAAGLSRATTVLYVLLPAAAPALIAGTVLGVARALAETAALVLTSGYVDRMPSSLLDSGRALSVHVYDLAMNVAGGDANACASALLLLLLVLAINLAARMGIALLGRTRAGSGWPGSARRGGGRLAKTTMNASPTKARS